MLISHRKNFIFTKTKKTAGTSVESYFEKFCVPEGKWEQKHGREETITEAGVVGYRGEDPKNSTYYNHMPAATIKELVGAEIWDSYFKFTVVRNPFDKMVSGFAMLKLKRERSSPIKPSRSIIEKWFGPRDPMSRVVGANTVEQFRSWIRNGGTFTDHDKYLIDGKLCVDYFIRFEDLENGIRDVCNVVGVPFSAADIPEFKKGIRLHTIPIREYYDIETERRVRQHFAWEINHFGYTMPL